MKDRPDWDLPVPVTVLSRATGLADVPPPSPPPPPPPPPPKLDGVSLSVAGGVLLVVLFLLLLLLESMLLIARDCAGERGCCCCCWWCWCGWLVLFAFDGGLGGGRFAITFLLPKVKLFCRVIGEFARPPFAPLGSLPVAFAWESVDARDAND
jgi:hypothetical protein